LFKQNFLALGTHQHPFGFLDDKNGDAKILELVEFIKPNFCMVGHVHKKNGKVKSFDLQKTKEITFINATCSKNIKLDFVQPKLLKLKNKLNLNFFF
jgi:predicted phosphohydrolase